MWLRIIRMTVANGDIRPVGTVLDVPEPDATRLVAMGKAERVPPETIQTREPVLTTRDPVALVRPTRPGRR